MQSPCHVAAHNICSRFVPHHQRSRFVLFGRLAQFLHMQTACQVCPEQYYSKDIIYEIILLTFFSTIGRGVCDSISIEGDGTTRTQPKEDKAMLYVNWETSDKTRETWRKAWQEETELGRAMEVGTMIGTIGIIAGYAQGALDSDSPDAMREAVEQILEQTRRR